MFKSYASKITSFLIENKEINQDDYEVYKYGFEVLIAFIVNIAIVLSIGLLFNKIFYSIAFLICYCPIRQFAGGYHADNHLNCCIIFAGIYVVSVFLRCIAEPPLVLCFIVVETLLILLLSPVESVNKQITSKRRRISRNRSIWILLANVVVCIVFLWVQPNNSYIEYYLISGFLASSTMIAGKIKLHFASRKKEGASL